jgi:hypothetical protein
MAQLSPPWYTLWNEINSSIGNDPRVTVAPLDTSQNPYSIVIQCEEHRQAVALVSLMLLQYSFGNVEVEVTVTDAAGDIVQPVVPTSAIELAKWVRRAFKTNNWFVDVHARSLLPPSNSFVVVYPIFARDVIQFFNDDLTDFYYNYNQVVAFVFQDVLQPTPGGITLNPSTAEVSCVP